MTMLLLLAQVTPSDDPAMRVGLGRIIGGWDFIYAGYAVSFVALSLYAISLWVRRPRSTGAPR